MSCGWWRRSARAGRLYHAITRFPIPAQSHYCHPPQSSRHRGYSSWRYFFNPQNHPAIPQQNDPANDDYLFNQAPTRGLGKIRFHDYDPVFAANPLPNVQQFKRQIDAFKRFLMRTTPSDAQTKDVDYLLAVGELFTLVVYAQLILENAAIYDYDDALIEQIFDVFVRDFSAYALQLYSKPSNSDAQMEGCLAMIDRPAPNPERYQAIWQRVHALKDQYEMPA